MVIFVLRNQRNGRAFVGKAYDPSCIMDCDFPETMKKDLQDCVFNRRIICEFKNADNIETKINRLLSAETNPYNDDFALEELTIDLELEDFDLV